MDMSLHASSIEDSQGVSYRGRALASSLGDTERMTDDAWRARLAASLAASGKSARAVSLKAELGPGYLHSILVEGKDPTVSRLTAVCDAMGVSAAYVLYGIDVTPEDEEVIRILRDDPQSRADLISLLKRRARA